MKLCEMKNKLKNSGVGCLLVITFLLFSINCTGVSNKSANQKLIRDYYAAYEKKDWNMLKSVLADGFTFSSPNDEHININTYKQKCWPNAYNIQRFDLDKVMVNGDEAFVTYNGWTKDGRVFRNTEYFEFKEGKIKENVCFFGPGISFPNNQKK